jgi:sodium/proline symporter
MVLGGLGIGLGTYGQPHLMVRFMALRDARALRLARWFTITWYTLVFGGMCLAGLAGHVLLASLPNPENVFFALTEQLFSPLVGAVLLAAVLSAIMSTADSQLLVAASAVAHDLKPGGWRHPMRASRLAVAALVLVSVLIALYLPERIFSRVLFAWSALGAAFGPLLFWRLARARVSAGGALASMLTGFGLSVALYLAPGTPGDVAERILPFLASLAVLWAARPRFAKMTPS